MSNSDSPHLRDPRRRRARTATSLLAAGLAVSLLGACTSSKSTTTSTTTASKDTGSSVAPSTGAVIKFKTYDAGGPLTVAALKSGAIDIAELFTFSPEITKNKWVILTDDKHLQAADNFVPAIRTSKVTPAITKVLSDVDAKLTQSGVADLVDQVSNQGQNPDDVAKKWLEKQGLPGNAKATGTLTVGTANFAESEIVGYIYGFALQDAGVKVTIKKDFGSRQVTTPALESGQLDLMPEFTASLLTYLDPKATPGPDLAAVYSALKPVAAAKGITVLPPSSVSDVNVFVVTSATASKYHLESISDLAKVSKSLTLGGPPECVKNSQCLVGLQKVYGLKFAVQ